MLCITAAGLVGGLRNAGDGKTFFGSKKHARKEEDGPVRKEREAGVN